MATTVIYNNVTLHNVSTREYDSETRYDASGTDVIGRIVKFTFTAILHSQNVATGAPAYVDLDGVARAGSVPDKAEWLQELLYQPRKTFIVKIANTEFFRCEPASLANEALTTTDRDNGPKPTSVKVTAIAGSKVFRVSFSITCWLANCDYLSASDIVKKSTAPVVNNRWSIKESMDDSYFITRTISGHIRLSSSLRSAHAYKSLCVPPLENGFARKFLDFEETANGLEATYTVTDKQVHTAAPWPLTKFEATHTESTSSALSFQSNMTVACWGDMSTSKADMLVRAVQIADSRLSFNDPKRNNFIFSSLAIIDHIGEENRLELHVSLQRFEDEQRTVFDLMAGQLGKAMELPDLPNTAGPDAEVKYKPNRSRRPFVFGYDQGGDRNPVESFLLHCYLQTPCSTDKGMWQGTPNQTTPSTEKAPQTEVTAAVVDSVTPEPPDNGYSKEHAEAIYTLCRLTSRYTTTGIVAHMPLSFTSQTSGKTSAIVKLGGGLCRRVLKVDCERVGEPPMVPKPLATYTDGANAGTLIDWWIEPNAPTLAPGGGGKKVHRITAYYLYGMNRPPNMDEAVSVGTLPFTSFDKADTSLDLGTTLSEDFGP